MQLIREYGDQANNPDNKKGYGIPIFYQCYLDHTNSISGNKIPSVWIFPNPTNGYLRIENGEWQIDNIEIFDIFGKNLFANYPINSSSNFVDISNLSAEIYIIKIISNCNIFTQKIIKYN